MRYQKRQNQWRRLLITSSSRTWSPSSAKRLGCGMNRRKIRSSRPRNAKTATAVATIAQPSAMSCDFQSQMNAAGAESTATNVAERRSERHWSESAWLSSRALSMGCLGASSAALTWPV